MNLAPFLQGCARSLRDGAARSRPPWLQQGHAVLHTNPHQYHSATPAVKDLSGPLLMVQPRHRKDLAESLRLVEACYKGLPTFVTTVGHSRMTRPGPAYFGLGATQVIKHDMEALEQPSDGETKQSSCSLASQVQSAVGWRGDQAEGDTSLSLLPRPERSGDTKHRSEPPSCRVFVNATLSPLQERNLSTILGRPITDRVGLIISIFAMRAQTREARMQVELASLMHQKSRLVRAPSGHQAGRQGFGEGAHLQVVSARQRGHSGSGSLGGGGGSGDPELQMQRYRILRRVRAIQAELRAVRETRELHRQGRRSAGIPQVAVVGYTNVGKSSLVTRLSGSELRAEDKLFVTLDPAVRRVTLPSGDACVMIDTVGFISDLPVELVEAFKATLEEVVQADLILHVLDASAPDVKQQRKSVLDLLLSLGVSPFKLRSRTIEVWNKCDLISESAAPMVAVHKAVPSRGVEYEASHVVPQAESATSFLDFFDPAPSDSRAACAPALRLKSMVGRRICWQRWWHQLGSDQLQRQRLQDQARPEVLGNTDYSFPEQHTTATPATQGSRLPVRRLFSDSPIAESSSRQRFTTCSRQGHRMLHLSSIKQGSIDSAVQQSCSWTAHEDAQEPGRAGSAYEAEAEAPGRQEAPAQGDEGRAKDILGRVSALMSEAHSSCPYAPVAVAMSAALGWGEEALLHLLEEKLMEAGLLRGGIEGRGHSRQGA